MRLISAMPTPACTRTQGSTMIFSNKAFARALLFMLALLALLFSTAARAQNNAAFVSQSVPTSMLTGATYNVTVAMSNTGGTTWTAANSLFLGSQNPENNATWGGARVAMPASVGPGGQANFAFQIIAPSAPGTYNFQWRMLQEGVEWFGALSPNVAVTVTAPAPHNDAQVISVSVPPVMTQGQGYTVAVTMKNSGNTTWPAGSAYALGSTIPQNTMLWGVNRIPLNSAVAPGQQTTLSFQVTAPAAGSYSMGWGMVQENVEWFGGTSSSAVTVNPPATGAAVTYIHTDALGSPVARTDAAGTVLNRTRYEPYGLTAGGATPTIGFTGHVNDADTGLVYMQQRYYDPVAGRFLSIDPVTTDANTGGSFNRYNYAGNNPYKYIDPDGRAFCGSYQCDIYDSGNRAGADSSSSGISTSAKVGAVVGGAAGGLAAAGCDIYSLGACAVANPAMVAGGIAGGAALGAVTGQQLDKAWVQLSGLIAKATTAGPIETQYALVAQSSGLYPDVRNGVVQLNAGDVWKYGTTSDTSNRYPQSALGTLNLRMDVQATGTRYQVLAAEKIKLIQYAIANGQLPPGNKIFK